MKALIHTGSPSALAEALDSASHPERIAFIQELGRADQRALWELAADAEPLTLEDFVPEHVPTGTPVTHHGCNTLPLPSWGRRFRKIMVRAPGGEIWGYNDSPFVVGIGPGFFTTRACRGAEYPHSSIVVDYHLLPAGPIPDAWPRLRPNWLGLQVLVYFHTRDYMRRVSRHVTIGMATKYGRPMGSWFALTREDRPPGA
ncbi:MAG TPA: hypothetical protein ENK18_09055 [Deltaproteobacteria bacterium]|nr:hypothetical protein [Deltaproteobacteria bacterium]